MLITSGIDGFSEAIQRLKNGGVLDGDLDAFVEAYLRWKKEQQGLDNGNRA